MPYEIRKSQSGYCVHKPGEDAPVSGGCHKSKSKATRHIRALYAAESTKEGKGYGARAGEVISGNLARGGDGKFSSAGEAAATEPVTAPTIRRQRLGRSAAARAERKRQTAEAKRQARAAESETKRQARAAATAKRKAEREARREADKQRKAEEKQRKLEENRKRTVERTPLNQESYDSLLAFAEARDGDFDPRMIEALAKETGLITVGANGSFRLNPEARAFLKAIDAGDARAALDAFERAGDRLEREEVQREKREESEKSTGLSVFKDRSGRYRWILLSSTAHRDRDGEIVSTKALAQDVERADTDRDFGPLRWWHVPGCDIGDCDFNILLGRVLVESGTFHSEAIGEAISKSQATLKASIGFRHPSSEPDREGVFHNIRRFERSLVPAGRAANPFTSLFVRGGNEMTVDDKLKELAGLVGEEALDSILTAARNTQKEADGVATYKEVTVSDVVTAIKAEGANTISVGTPGAFTAAEGVGTGALTFSANDLALEVDSAEYAGDLAPDDLVGRIATAVAQALTPHMAELGEAVKSLREGRATKDDQIALLQEQQTRKSTADTQALAALKAQQEALATSMKDVSEKIAELAGEAPRAQGYRASQAPETAINKPDEHRLKEAAPQGIDPNFLGNMLRGTGMAGAAEELPDGW